MRRGIFIVAGCQTINGSVNYNSVAIEEPANRANLLDANGIPLLGYQYQVDICKNNVDSNKAQVILHLKDDQGKIIPKPVYILNLELNKNTRLKIPGTNQWLVCGLADFEYNGTLNTEVNNAMMDKICQITGLKLKWARGYDLGNPEDQPGGNE